MSILVTLQVKKDVRKYGRIFTGVFIPTPALLALLGCQLSGPSNSKNG